MIEELVELRKRMVLATQKSGEGHLASAFSVIDILWTLYNRALGRFDHFILSKGHAALALYAVLAAQNKIDPRELENFGVPGSRLGGHPDCTYLSGIVEASTGSLGHGLAIGCGMALALRIKRAPGRIYVLVGDGECQEGAVWEAARLASVLDLEVTCLVDDNLTHAMYDLFSMFTAFGWHCRKADGHNVYDIEKALRPRSGPLAVIFETVKGKGSSSMEADPGAWHHRAPHGEELAHILREIEAA